MTYLSDSYSQEQEQEFRAQEVRSILERTFALAQKSSTVVRTEDGLWQYVGNEHTLIYNPDSDSLWIAANSESWQLGYHEQAFLSGNSAQITDEQLQGFRELGAFLDRKNIPEAIDLRTLTSAAQRAWEIEHTILPKEQQIISESAARLFESYVEHTEEAYKESPDSSEWFYRVMVNDAIYLVSRDDATMTYNVQREDVQPMGRTDLQTWQDIDSWLTQQEPVNPKFLADPKDGWQGTYWEQQVIRANTILPIAEQLFAYQEHHGTLHLNEAEQSYISDIGGYTVGYVLPTDTFWLDLDGERLISATNWIDNCDQDGWQLRGLNHLGRIATYDVEQFQSLQTWLQVKYPEWETVAEHEHSLINTYRRDRSKLSDIQTSDTSVLVPEAPTPESSPMSSAGTEWLKPSLEDVERG